MPLVTSEVDNMEKLDDDGNPPSDGQDALDPEVVVMEPSPINEDKQIDVGIGMKDSKVIIGITILLLFANIINFCELNFVSKTRMKQHVWVEHKEFQPIFSLYISTNDEGLAECQSGDEVEMCPECGKMFELKWKLKAHIKNVHTFGHFTC